jgi:hypothetical protein
MAASRLRKSSFQPSAVSNQPHLEPSGKRTPSLIREGRCPICETQTAKTFCVPSKQSPSIAASLIWHDTREYNSRKGNAPAVAFWDYNVSIDSISDATTAIQDEEMAMRRTAIIISLVLILALSARGQGNYPKGEVFGGYAFSHYTVDNIGRNLNGWGVGVSGNLTRYFGLAADFSGVYGSEPPYPRVVPAQPGISSDPVSVGAYHFLAGPRFTLRTRTVAPFAHAMFGLKDLRQELAGNWLTFAMGFGGGVDVRLGKHAAYRIFQADYIPAKRPLGLRGWDSDFRLQTGLVFRFGMK